MKKLLLLFAFLTLSVGLWAQTVGDCFTDDVSGLEFEVTAVGDNNTVMVIPNDYNGTDYTIPSFVTYQNVTFYVTAIDMLAFRASSLQSVTMPEGLTTIDILAFYAAVNLQSVTIPASVNSIGKSAFADCSSLRKIFVSWTKESDIPQIDPNVFLGIASHAVLRVPAGTKALYQAADGWNNLEIYDPAATIPTTYVDADGTSHDINALPVFDATYRVDWGETGTTTWYVVNGTDMQLPKGAICNGDIRLILADGAKLTATGDVDPKNELAGILVSGNGNSLTIYGQTNQSGQLIATGSYSCAGIGGVPRGGGSNITINGGTITATGGTNAAGIGGGSAKGGNNIVTINGGTIAATGGEGAAGIGRTLGSTDDNNIFVATNCIVKAGDTADPTDVIENSGADLASSLASKQYVTISTTPPTPPTGTDYIDENGIEQTVNSVDEVTSSDEIVYLGTSGTDTWYIVTGTDVTLSKGAICNGDVRLILADGAKLTASGGDFQAGIQVSGNGNSLTIYGQTNQSGQLIATATCEFGAAGIGGGTDSDGSNITINGGTITASGYAGGAGIGGGAYGVGSNITINGGTVTANGEGGGAAIGGGSGANGSYITINGGIVTANGGVPGAGIGGGAYGVGSNITINGGTVTANGGARGAGIGGGYQGSGSNITINGGTVTANGGDSADGIGNGWNGSASSNITVATILVVKADGNNPPTTVIGNMGSNLAGSLAGKRYVTVTDDVCNLTVNQDPKKKEHYYSTFYSGKKAYAVHEGVTAYTGVVDGNVLKLTSITDGIIPAGEAVILRLTTADNTATKKQFALTATTTTATKSTNNALTGTDVAIEELGANDYALSLGHNGVGFYLWDGMTISAHKAYLTLTDPSIKALIFQFEDDSTTGIATPSNSPEEGEAVAYDVTGVRVSNNYKGVVIKNGKKVIR